MIRLRVGDVLLEQGLLSKEQLERALEVQKQTGGLLGEVLVKNGFVTEETISKALSRQFGLPYASKANGLLVIADKDGLRGLIPQEFARAHQLIPLFVRDETLGVAVADPMDVITMDNLRILTGKNVMVYIATKSEISSLLDEMYGIGQVSETNLADMAKAAAVQKQKSDSGSTLEEVAEERTDLDKVTAEAGEARVVALVNQIIKQAIEERASDIHIEPMEDIVNLRFRIDGVLHEKPPPAKALSASIISRIKILSKLNVAERRVPQDGAFAVKQKDNVIDLRVSTCPTVFGEKAVMRILNKGAVDLSVDKLGMEPKQKEDFVKTANAPHGLIFLTGPTGSGKTTTLYSILKAIQSPEINIMTLEDPVEYKLRGINQVQIRTNVGLTFAAGLRSFLRQDPDVILVGEVRDLETAELCIRAAMTGHLVLSTLHTNDALSSTLRLQDLGVEPFLVSSTMILVAAQRLLRILCENCKEAYQPEKELIDSLGLPYVEKMYKPKGCPACSNTGYKGRHAIYEVIPLNERLRTAIQKKVSLSEMKQITRDSGLMTMKESGYLKVQRGLTDLEEYLSVINVDEG